jgi:hypothetical protein
MWTPDMLVEFFPDGLALMMRAEVETAAYAEGVGVGVGVVEATTGYKAGSRLFTSEGRAWYQAGVLPAAREDAMLAAKADDEASA